MFIYAFMQFLSSCFRRRGLPFPDRKASVFRICGSGIWFQRDGFVCGAAARAKVYNGARCQACGGKGQGNCI